MAKGQKAEVEVARQLFIYGAGDGKRVISVRALCEATGLHEQTIGVHLPKWQKEVEEILINSNISDLGLSLSAKDLDQHKTDMEAIRSQLAQIQWELDRHDEITAALQDWASTISTEDPEFGEKSFRILETYLRMSGSKATLRGQLLSYQKQWATMAGIVDLKDISVIAAKEMSKGRAKMKLKSEENQDAPKNVGGLSSGVFARVGNTPRPAQIDETKD